MKLVRDFGVRALLATLTVVAFELLVITVVRSIDLDLQGALTILGLAQTPAMLALGFYFGQRGSGAPTS